jgi:hypothetical protein
MRASTIVHRRRFWDPSLRVHRARIDCGSQPHTGFGTQEDSSYFTKKKDKLFIPAENIITMTLLSSVNSWLSSHIT